MRVSSKTFVSSFLSFALASVSSIALTAPAGASSTDVACADRVVVAGLSSSERTPAMRQRVITIAAHAAIGAAVCDTDLAVYGVAGSAQIFQLLANDDVAPFVPTGPNADVRRSRLDGDAEPTFTRIATRRLDAAYRDAPDASVSSVATLYSTAAEHASSDTHVVIVTDGVNHDDVVDLDRPLNAGEGKQLATTLDIPRISNPQTTVVGLGQVDADHPAPGNSWSTEVRAFNRKVCALSDATRCRLFSVASTGEALGS